MVVSGDEYLLKIAVSNLMDNACKYSPDHTVEVKIGQSEDRIKVVFEDKGIGIPEEDLGKIFEPFYRAGNTITYQGSGIGLPLVKQIISNHNGTIEIYSRVGKGTRITVTFPLSIGTKEEN
jgi:signal transduction histidine kinase